MTEKIHPAGSVLSDVVIEPIGNLEYVWFKKPNKRGIAQAYAVYESKTNEEGEETRFGKPKLLYYAIDIDGEQYRFGGLNPGEAKPLKKLIFYVPNREKIEDWSRFLINAKKPDFIFTELKRGIHVCLDFPLEYHYDVTIIRLLQSWVLPKLNSVFYGGVVGGFGGGKTAALETEKCLLKHGMMAADISNAGIARTASKYKLSLCYDEIDARNKNNADSEVYTTLRQGQRRGNYYLRLQQKTFEEELYDIFGYKAYTMHADVERALKMRTLLNNIGETDDKRLPIINSLKESVLFPIYDDLFFWYLENICDVPEVKDDLPAELFLNDSLTSEEIRAMIYKSATSNLTEYLDLLSEFRGRNIELAYTALKVSKIFGIDVINSLQEAFREKKSIEGDYSEDDVMTMMKDVLIEWYEIEKNKVGEQETPFVERKLVYNDVNTKLETEHMNRVSNFKFTKDLRNFGFVDGVTMKKKKIEKESKMLSVLCLFFDDRVKYKLGIKVDVKDGQTTLNDTTATSETSATEVRELSNSTTTATTETIATDNRDNNSKVAEVGIVAKVSRLLPYNTDSNSDSDNNMKIGADSK